MNAYVICRAVLAAVFVAGLSTGPLSDEAAAQQVKPACTENSRDCMIRAAQAYLDSIVTHDAGRVPFARGIKRTEQGRPTGTGEDELRALQKLQPDMAGLRDVRFFVDEGNRTVIAFALLRVTGTKADPARRTFTDNVPAGQQKPSTVHLAERFKVENGLITEIEAIFHTQAGSMDHQSGWE